MSKKDKRIILIAQCLINEFPALSQSGSDKIKKFWDDLKKSVENI